MGKVPIELVKELHKVSGVSVLDCKKALLDADCDLGKAKTILGEKGFTLASKKACRVAAEGAIALECGTDFGVLVEINCETDFVARSGEFQRLCKEVCSYAFQKKCSKVSELREEFENKVSQGVSALNEKIEIRRVALSQGDQVFSYIHNSYPGASHLGKIGALISVASKAENIKELFSNICMHVAASQPIALREEDLDSGLLKEKKLLFATLGRKEGKPEKLISRIVEGKMRSFYKDVVLLNQQYIMDETKSVAQVINDHGKSVGEDLSVESFSLLVLGHGVEKPQEDFAKAVKKAAEI